MAMSQRNRQTDQAGLSRRRFIVDAAAVSGGVVTLAAMAPGEVLAQAGPAASARSRAHPRS
jgi:hypothetical protein